MCWRLLIEQFGPELIYIKGKHNVAADALSRLPLLTAKEDCISTSTSPLLVQRGHH
jgi:hypothetical protein